MRKYIIKRLLQSFVTIFLVVIVVFMLLRLMPVSGYFTRDDYTNMTVQMRNAYLKSLGLYDNPIIQFKNFIVNVFRGDLGRSITVYPKTRITEILAQKAPYSIKFGMAGMALSLVLGVTLGITMARFKDKLADTLGTFYVVLVRAIPSLIYLFLIQIWVTG